MDARAWSVIALLALVWGGAFFFTELLVPHVGPMTVAGGRIAIAALGFWALAALRGRAPAFTAAAWSRYMLGGLITFAIPFFCLAWAQGLITGGLAAIINAMTPIMMVIVSHFYPGGEKASWLKAAGVAVGFAGVLVLILPSAAQTGVGGALIAQLVALLAPVSYALAGNYTRIFQGEEPTLTITGTMTGAALWTMPLALILEGPPGALPISAIAAFLAIGLISTALAFRMFYVMLPKIGPTNFSVVTFLVPISAMGLGALFIDERIEPAQLAGMAVIFLGLILVDGRLPRRLAGRA